nr:unnamed protein product [Digitaria exilis]
MRAKRSRPYAAAKYSSTSGCHRSFGLNVYRPLSEAASCAAEGEGEEESIRSDGGRPRGRRRMGRLRPTGSEEAARWRAQATRGGRKADGEQSAEAAGRIEKLREEGFSA